MAYRRNLRAEPLFSEGFHFACIKSFNTSFSGHFHRYKAIYATRVESHEHVTLVNMDWSTRTSKLSNIQIRVIKIDLLRLFQLSQELFRKGRHGVRRLVSGKKVAHGSYCREVKGKVACSSWRPCFVCHSPSTAHSTSTSSWLLPSSFSFSSSSHHPNISHQIHVNLQTTTYNANPVGSIMDDIFRNNLAARRALLEALHMKPTPPTPPPQQPHKPCHAYSMLRENPGKWFRGAIIDDRDRALLPGERASFVEYSKASYLRKIVSPLLRLSVISLTAMSSIIRRPARISRRLSGSSRLTMNAKS